MRRTTAVSAIAIALVLVAGGCDSDDDAESGATTTEESRTVTISGVTFAFGSGDLVADVAVGIAEDPDVAATSDENGRYTLTVPDGSSVTPVVEHPGFRTMHIQTFETAGDDLESVNFQMVDEGVYEAFAAVLEIEPDPARCQIATTVNTIEIRDLTFDEFGAFGPHGVAGATVTAEPPIPDTVYFNEDVVPDRSLSETSEDGGVVWPNVEPGVYEIRAAHADTEFAPLIATCEAGRLINAGPPWGLREEGPEDS